MVIEGSNLFRTILNRLQEIEGVATDTALAVPLKMERRNLTSYKERGSVPWDKLLEYSRRKQISLEWLVNGRGPQSISHAVAEESATYNAIVEPGMMGVAKLGYQFNAALKQLSEDEQMAALTLLWGEPVAYDIVNGPSEAVPITQLRSRAEQDKDKLVDKKKKSA